MNVWNRSKQLYNIPFWFYVNDKCVDKTKWKQMQRSFKLLQFNMTSHEKTATNILAWTLMRKLP